MRWKCNWSHFFRKQEKERYIVCCNNNLDYVFLCSYNIWTFKSDPRTAFIMFWLKVVVKKFVGQGDIFSQSSKYSHFYNLFVCKSQFYFFTLTSNSEFPISQHNWSSWRRRKNNNFGRNMKPKLCFVTNMFDYFLLYFVCVYHILKQNCWNIQIVQYLSKLKCSNTFPEYSGQCSTKASLSCVSSIPCHKTAD